MSNREASAAPTLQVQPPRDEPPGGVVARSVLIGRIRTALESGRVVLLKAGVGYGKSVALRQLADELAGDAATRPVLLPLTVSHQSPASFAAAIERALAGARADAPPLAGGGAMAAGRSPAGVISDAVSALGSFNGTAVLILDQYHRVAGPEIDSLLAALIECAPPSLRLVIAARAAPSALAAELRLSGALREFIQDDLAFSAEEAAKFCSGELSESELAVLMAKTEGWPAAMQLFRLSCAKSASVSIALERFGARDLEVSEYLKQAIINALPPELREFLIDISILKDIDADGANVIRGRADSQVELDRLCDQGVVLSQSGSRAASFRLHPLLAEYLRARLSGLRGDEVIAEMHQRASRWYEDAGDKLFALRHSVEADDEELVARLIRDEGGGGVLWLSKNIEAAEEVMRQLIRRSPSKAVKFWPMYALSLGRAGRLSDAVQVINDARSEFNELVEKSAEPTRADLALIEATIAIYTSREDIDALVSELEHLRIRGVSSDSVYPATINNVLGVLYFRSGDPQRADRALREAERAYEAAGSNWSIVYTLIHAAMVAIEQCEMNEARALIERAYKVHAGHFPPEDARAAMIDLVRARLHALASLSEDDLDTANKLVLGATPRVLRNKEYWSELLHAAFTTEAMLQYARFGVRDGLEALSSGIETARDRGLHRLARGFSGAQLRLASLASDFETADRLLEEVGEAGEWRAAIGWQDEAELQFGLARLDIARGRAQAAIDRMTRMHQAAADAGLRLVALKCIVLKVLALFASGHEADATAKLRLILPKLSDGARGLLLEEGPLARKLLDDAATRISRSIERDALLPTIVEMRTLAGGWRAPEATIGPKPPSGTAMEVLSRIAGGMRPKDIAAELGITVDGVNHHLKSMRRKLEVNSTPALVSEAVRLGFLEDVSAAGKHGP